MNEYDEIDRNIYRCFGSNDNVFRAGRSERQAAEEVKRAIISQGVSMSAVRSMVGDYLLSKGVAHQSIEEYHAEAIAFFFAEHYLVKLANQLSPMLEEADICEGLNHVCKELSTYSQKVQQAVSQGVDLPVAEQRQLALLSARHEELVDRFKELKGF